MAHTHLLPRTARRRQQRGMTLIEFMVTITIGMIMVAALATLIADQSGNRAEVDRAGRMIENGRYGIRAITDDLQLAGYWGELNGTPQTSEPGTLPDPCLVDTADRVLESTFYSVQGVHSGTVGSPAASPSCLSDHLPGTDVLVVRHADPDTSSLESAPGVVDLASLTNKYYYVQTGLNAAGTAFASKLAIAVSDADDATAFDLKKKDKVSPATVRKVTMRMYYVARCSVQGTTGCTNGDGGNPIPTLKMRELGINSAGDAGWTAPVTLAEGIENLQVDYGVDTDADGSPEVDAGGEPVSGYVDGNALTKSTWPNVVAVKIYLLARGLEPTPGYSEATLGKKYVLGTYGEVTPADGRYKRHVFVQSVRLVNPSARRQS